MVSSKTMHMYNMLLWETQMCENNLNKKYQSLNIKKTNKKFQGPITIKERGNIFSIV